MGPIYACGECFGPLEVAYEFPSTLSRAHIEAGNPGLIGHMCAEYGLKKGGKVRDTEAHWRTVY